MLLPRAMADATDWWWLPSFLLLRVIFFFYLVFLTGRTKVTAQ